MTRLFRIAGDLLAVSLIGAVLFFALIVFAAANRKFRNALKQKRLCVRAKFYIAALSRPPLMQSCFLI